ncbi:Asp-tRNA(Asn)/Glu-tRNA(Gln) amidotransferase subunit GatA [Fundicoccus culcitae]|uniref:Glutamyl-tRNA(Gln) amidotransferase subunit A n=1 Tax=Fundicoccus culcitae TaxID=2969821 RepID=A0ABY5P5H9_9LACT|nr:Asp-tRNA(Asn)/Glu-tRNA(Gln) amidotransferase subunit GatA [Fundicoccus culcitae]UUX33826.1 Asp-tRNA(Asn)/Glu-tRNA(Gln) amidotransferase subunit GatA [Fundicoccus culcitae]
MSHYPETIKGMKDGLAQGTFTSVDLVKAAFEKIAATDEHIGAYLRLNEEKALEAAQQADERGYGPDAPLLNGIPVAVKDNILTENLVTTAASKMLENFIPTYDATVVSKLKAAGAVIVGKVNMDEFAMGSTTERSAFKITHNPWNLDRVPGGSSGGSAATVAARQVPASLGTDTGGSIRQPAAFNGIVGLKPTYGLVSRYGVVAFGSSFDQVGPMTLTVEDNALLLEAIAGHDAHDSTSLADQPSSFSEKIGQSIAGMKIAFPKEFKSDFVSKDIRDAVQTAADFFESKGAIIEEVSLPHTQYGTNVYYIIASSEASSNLQRFDGIRYGYRSKDATNLEEIYVNSRSEGFGSEVKNRIMLGTYSLSAGSFDLYYKKAAQVRTLIIQDFKKIFADYDIILGPTTTSTAYEIGGKIDNPIEMYVADILTVTANIAGIPAISIPVGFDGDGMPIGLQMHANSLNEATLYQIASIYEAEHDFHLQKPSLKEGN